MTQEDKVEVLIGTRFGRLVVIDVEAPKSKRKALCQCDCGKTKLIRIDSLTGGKTNSCSCLSIDVRKASKQPIIGLIFNNVEVIGEAEQQGDGGKFRRIAICRCFCGLIKNIRFESLKSGKIRSCGCLRDEVASKRMTTHGKSKTTEYTVWNSMIERCRNPNHKQFQDYGGRGIIVCERWKYSFDNFLSDMGHRPSMKHTLDRKDNDGIYEPANCRWATYKEQRSNTRTNRWAEHNGQRLILSHWAEKFNVGATKFSSYVKRHSIEDAIAFYSKKNKSNL